MTVSVVVREGEGEEVPLPPPPPAPPAAVLVAPLPSEGEKVGDPPVGVWDEESVSAGEAVEVSEPPPPPPPGPPLLREGRGEGVALRVVEAEGHGECVKLGVWEGNTMEGRGGGRGRGRAGRWAHGSKWC